MHWKINSDDLVFFLHLNMTSVVSEELVHSRLRECFNFCTDFWKNYSELINEDENIEAFCDAAFKRVFRQRCVDLAVSCIFRKVEF